VTYKKKQTLTFFIIERIKKIS